MSDELLHSPLGPSAAERWILCPGSVLLTKDLPDHSSEYAIEGTAAHTLSEWCRLEGAPAISYRGRTIEVPTNDGVAKVVVTVEMAHAVQEFVDYVQQFEGDAFYEMRVSFSTWVPDGFGTADDIRVADGVCRVTDLKFGTGVQVYAKDNPQLKLYALGVFQELQYLYDFERFVLAIHQPRLDHVDEWEIDLPALLAWAQDVAKPAAKMALEPGAPLAAGEHCRFCLARQTCTVRAQANLAEVLSDFEDLDDVKHSELLDPLTLTNDQMAHILARLDDIKRWCSDVETRAVAEILDGHPVGDWKLVEGRSNRKWKDESQAEQALRGSKLKVADIFVKKLISPTQAEKLLGKKHPIMIHQVVKPRGAPKLAPGNDPRRPYEVTAEDEFEDLDEESGSE